MAKGSATAEGSQSSGSCGGFFLSFACSASSSGTSVHRMCSDSVCRASLPSSTSSSCSHATGRMAAKSARCIGAGRGSSAPSRTLWSRKTSAGRMSRSHSDRSGSSAARHPCPSCTGSASSHPSMASSRCLRCRPSSMLQKTRSPALLHPVSLTGVKANLGCGPLAFLLFLGAGPRLAHRRRWFSLSTSTHSCSSDRRTMSLASWTDRGLFQM
mmetsp:Transcript_3618/g.11331  ORF Transcript_3618/g.11331 Transcript_3618/m.11331 type:complete len:213 (-) Transcript_3618:2540-3178(-)